jgi:O-antigen ligase
MGGHCINLVVYGWRRVVAPLWTFKIPLLRFFVHSGILCAVVLMPTWYRLDSTPFAPLYVSRFALLLPMLLAIAAWFARGMAGIRSGRANWALPLLLLAIWAFASQGWAFVADKHPEVATNAALQWALVALFAVVVACDGPSPRAIVGVLVFGLLLNGAIIFGQATLQGPVGLQMLDEFNITPDTVGASVVVSGEIRWLRPYGLLPHPNIAAGMVLMGWLSATALLWHPRHWVRWLGVAALCVGVFALLQTFSRAAWLGALAGVAVLLPLWLGLVRRTIPMPSTRLMLWHQLRALPHSVWISVALVLVTAGIFAATFWPLLIARAGVGLENTELRSVSDRLVFTDLALRAIEQAPLLGVGIGNFPWRASADLADTFFDLRGDNVHHVFLSAWAETGLVGFLLLSWALVGATLRGFHAIKATPDSAPYRAGLLAAGVALCVVGLFDHYLWTLFPCQAVWWCLFAASHAEQETA